MVDEQVEAQITVKEADNGSEKLSKEKLLELTLQWHEEFDRDVWHKGERRPSFHNRMHVEAVERSRIIYFEKFDENDDPLRVQEDLEKWNEQHPEAQFSLEEFKEGTRLFVATHDLGNIMRKLTKKQCILEPDFLPAYTAGKDDADEDGSDKDAEARGHEIVEFMIRNSDIKGKNKTIVLLKHLFQMSKYRPEVTDEDREQPFFTFVQTIDQVGNDLYSENEDRVIGLAKEMLSEDSDAEINPYKFFNFSKERLEQLVPDSDEREKLLAMWTTLPQERPDFPNNEMKIADFLKDERFGN
jgi:hypothetical protein